MGIEGNAGKQELYETLAVKDIHRAFDDLETTLRGSAGWTQTTAIVDKQGTVYTNKNFEDHLGGNASGKKDKFIPPPPLPTSGRETVLGIVETLKRHQQSQHTARHAELELTTIQRTAQLFQENQTLISDSNNAKILLDTVFLLVTQGNTGLEGLDKKTKQDLIGYCAENDTIDTYRDFQNDLSYQYALDKQARDDSLVLYNDFLSCQSEGQNTIDQQIATNNLIFSLMQKGSLFHRYRQMQNPASYEQFLDQYDQTLVDMDLLLEQYRIIEDDQKNKHLVGNRINEEYPNLSTTIQQIAGKYTDTRDPVFPQMKKIAEWNYSTNEITENERAKFFTTIGLSTMNELEKYSLVKQIMNDRSLSDDQRKRSMIALGELAKKDRHVHGLLTYLSPERPLGTVRRYETDRDKNLADALIALHKQYKDLTNLSSAQKSLVQKRLLELAEIYFGRKKPFLADKHIHKKPYAKQQEAINYELIQYMLDLFRLQLEQEEKTLLALVGYENTKEYMDDACLYEEFVFDVSDLFQNMRISCTEEQFRDAYSKHEKTLSTIRKTTGYDRPLTGKEKNHLSKIDPDAPQTLDVYHQHLTTGMHQELEKLRKKQSAEYGIAIYENRQLQWMMLNARSEDEPFSSEDRMLYFALLPLVEKIGTYGWLDGYQRYTKEIENATATFTDTLGLRDMDPVFRYFQGMNTLRETYLSRGLHRDRFDQYNTLRQTTPGFVEKQQTGYQLLELMSSELSLGGGGERFPQLTAQKMKDIKKQVIIDSIREAMRIGGKGGDLPLKFVSGARNGIIQNTRGAGVGLGYFLRSRYRKSQGRPGRVEALKEVKQSMDKRFHMPVSSMMSQPLSANAKLSINLDNYLYQGGTTVGQMLTYAIGAYTPLGVVGFAATTQFGNYYAEGVDTFGLDNLSKATGYALIQAGIAGMVERIMPDRDIVFGNTNPINTELTKQVIARTVLKSILQKHAKEQAEEQLQGLGEDGVKRFYNRFETLAQTFETLTRADATATALVTLFTLGFGGGVGGVGGGAPSASPDFQKQIDGLIKENKGEEVLKLLQTQLQTMIESQSKADRTPPTMVSLLEQITKLDNSQGSVDSVIMELIQEINTERAVSAPTITETVEEQQNTSSSETPATVTEAELNTITSLEQEQQKLGGHLLEQIRIEDQSTMSPIEKAMLLVEHCGGIDRFKHADGTPMTLEELAEILDTAHRKQGKLFQHTTTELKVKIAYLQLAGLTMPQIKIAFREGLCGQQEGLSRLEQEKLKDVYFELEEWGYTTTWIQAIKALCEGPMISLSLRQYAQGKEGGNNPYIFDQSAHLQLSVDIAKVTGYFRKMLTNHTPPVEDGKTLTTYLKRLKESGLQYLPSVTRAEILLAIHRYYSDKNNIDELFNNLTNEQSDNSSPTPGKRKKALIDVLIHDAEGGPTYNGMPLATYLAKPGNIKLITSLGDYTLPIPALVLSPEAMYALGWEGIYGRLVHNIPKNSPIKSYTNKFIILEHQETIDPNNNEDMQLMIHIYKHELQHYLHDYYDLESKVDLFYNELVAKVSDIAPSDGNGRARIIITLIGGDYGMLDNERHEKKDTLSGVDLKNFFSERRKIYDEKTKTAVLFAVLMMTNQSVHHLKKEQVLDMILLTDTDQKKAIIDHLISLSGKNKELATLVTGWIESIHEGYLRVGTFNNRLFQDRPVDSGPLDWQTTLTIDSIAKHKEPRSLLDKLRIQEQSNRDKDKKARFLLETCRRKSLPIRQDGAHTVTDAQKAKIAERIDTAHTMPGELFTLGFGQKKAKVQYLLSKGLSSEAVKIALTEGLCGRAPTYQPEEQQEIDALTRLLVDQVYNIYADPSADQTANIGTITDAIVPLIQNNAQSLITYIKTVKTDKQETPFEVTMQDQIATVTTALKNKLLENMGTSGMGTDCGLLAIFQDPSLLSLPTVVRLRIITNVVQFLLDRQQTLRELEQVNLTKLVASLLNQQGDTGAESFIAYCIQEKFIYLDTNKVPLPAVMVDDRFRDHFGFSSTSRGFVAYLGKDSPYRHIASQLPVIRKKPSDGLNQIGPEKTYDHEVQHIVSKYFHIPIDPVGRFVDELAAQIRSADLHEDGWIDILRVLSIPLGQYDFCYQACEREVLNKYPGKDLTDQQVREQLAGQIEKLYTEKYPNYLIETRKKFCFAYLLWVSSPAPDKDLLIDSFLLFSDPDFDIDKIIPHLESFHPRFSFEKLVDDIEIMRQSWIKDLQRLYPHIYKFFLHDENNQPNSDQFATINTQPWIEQKIVTTPSLDNLQQREKKILVSIAKLSGIMHYKEHNHDVRVHIEKNNETDSYTVTLKEHPSQKDIAILQVDLNNYTLLIKKLAYIPVAGSSIGDYLHLLLDQIVVGGLQSSSEQQSLGITEVSIDSNAGVSLQEYKFLWLYGFSNASISQTIKKLLETSPETLVSLHKDKGEGQELIGLIKDAENPLHVLLRSGPGKLWLSQVVFHTLIQENGLTTAPVTWKKQENMDDYLRERNYRQQISEFQSQLASLNKHDRVDMDCFTRIQGLKEQEHIDILLLRVAEVTGMSISPENVYSAMQDPFCAGDIEKAILTCVFEALANPQTTINSTMIDHLFKYHILEQVSRFPSTLLKNKDRSPSLRLLYEKYQMYTFAREEIGKYGDPLIYLSKKYEIPQDEIQTILDTALGGTERSTIMPLFLDSWHVLLLPVIEQSDLTREKTKQLINTYVQALGPLEVLLNAKQGYRILPVDCRTILEQWLPTILHSFHDNPQAFEEALTQLMQIVETLANYQPNGIILEKLLLSTSSPFYGPLIASCTKADRSFLGTVHTILLDDDYASILPMIKDIFSILHAMIDSYPSDGIGSTILPQSGAVFEKICNYYQTLTNTNSYAGMGFLRNLQGLGEFCRLYPADTMAVIDQLFILFQNNPDDWAGNIGSDVWGSIANKYPRVILPLLKLIEQNPDTAGELLKGPIMVIGKWCPPDHEALVDALIAYINRETVKNNKDTLRSIALLEHLPPSSPIIDMLTYLLANHHKNIPLYIQKLSEIASITDDPSIWEDITGFHELFAIHNREQLTHDLGENSLQNNRYMQYFSKMYALLPQVLREQPYSEFPAKVEQLLTQISHAIKKDPSCIVKGTHHVMGLIKKVQHYVATIYAQYLIAYADHIVKEKLQSAFSETPGVLDKYKENPAFQEICTMYLHMVAKDHKNVPLAKKLIDDILSDLDLQSVLQGNTASLRTYLSKNDKNKAFIDNTLPDKGKEKRFEDNKKTYQNQGGTPPRLTIYRETNPLHVCLMGKGMRGSCLDFNNPLGNYPSVFVNALDANKAVFFITDENENIIARVLVGIDNKKNLYRASLYIKDDAPAFDEDAIEKIVDLYVAELSGELGLRIGTDDTYTKNGLPILQDGDYYRHNDSNVELSDYGEMRTKLERNEVLVNQPLTGTTFQEHFDAGHPICVYNALPPYNNLLQIKQQTTHPTEQGSSTDQDLLHNPASITTAPTLSTALISKDKTTTISAYGIGVGGSYANVQDPAILPRRLLDKLYSSYSYNEVVLENKPEQQITPLFVYVKTFNGRPIVSASVYSELQTIAKENNLELVHIEDPSYKKHIDNDFDLIFYSNDSEFECTISEHGVVYEISLNQGRWTFFKHIGTTQKKELMTADDIDLLVGILDKHVGEQRRANQDPGSNRKLRQQTMLDTIMKDLKTIYQKSLYTEDTENKKLTIHLMGPKNTTYETYVIDKKKNESYTQTTRYTGYETEINKKDLTDIEKTYLQELLKQAVDANTYGRLQSTYFSP